MGLKLSYLNWIDAASTVIEADSETTDMVGAAVARSLAYEVWRTVQVSDALAGIQFDFGQDREIGVIAFQVPRTNDIADYDFETFFAADDQIRILVSDTDAHDGNVLDTDWIDSGCLPGFGTLAIWLDTPLTARYLRIEFNATSQASRGYFDVSRIWAGPVLAPRVGVSYGMNTMWDSDSIIAKANRGTSRFATPQESLRVWSFNLDWLDDTTERKKFADFERRVTTAAEFLIHNPFEAAGEGDMFCYLSNTTGLTYARFNISTKTMRVEENI